MRGVIDLHTHGIGPWNGRTLSQDVLRELVRAQGQAGTAGILVTLYPEKPTELREKIELVGSFMETPREAGNARVLGVHLEGPFCNPAQAGALDPQWLRSPGAGDVPVLLDGVEDIVRVITVAPEIPGAEWFIRTAAERGVRVQMGHSAASWEDARRGKAAGASGVTHLWNAMGPFHHRAPGLAGFALWDRDLYVEIIPDGEHVADPVVDLVLRLKRPDRILFVSDSVAAPAGPPAAARTADGRLAGGGRPLGHLADRLTDRGVPEDLVRAGVRKNPLRYLGLDEDCCRPSGS